MNSQDVIRKVYNSDAESLRTSLVSTPTVFAVVSADIIIGDVVGIAGNVTLSDSKKYIGLTTTTLGIGTQKIGLVTLNPSNAYIGLVSVSGKVGFSGNVTLDDGSLTGLVAGTAKIGLVTLNPSNAFIGLVTAVQAGVARTITGNITLSNSKNFIGLVTSVPSNVARTITGNLTLSDSKAYIGLVSVQGSVGIKGNLTLSDSKGYVGLVTTTPGSEYASPSIIQGMVSGASGAVMQLGNNAVSWCLVKAHPGNSTTVYVGPSLASVNVSFPLDPGETTGYSVSNTNLLYMCAVDTSELRFTGGL